MRAATALTGALALAGAGAAIALAVAAVEAGESAVLLPGALPVAFLLAGVLGARAQAGHRGVQLLLAVGSLHLVGFAASEAWVAAGRPQGTGPWLLTVLSVAAFAGGFAALALLLATYPDGRPTIRVQAWFAGLCVGTVALLVLVVLLFSESAPVVLSRDQATVAAPDGLPLVALGIDLQPLLPLLVVAAVVVLLARGRRGSLELRRHLEWASLAGIVLAVLLLATPAATALLPGAVWSVVFVSFAGLVPFALLGGLVRHRLLDVDVLVVRTLARGGMVVVVLTCYAVAASALAGSGSARVAASVALTLLAVLTGWPALRRAEALADRWFTGGRVRRGALLTELGATLSATEPEALPERIADALREGFDASWVRVSLGEEVMALSGVGDPHPATAVDLRCGGEQVGMLELGPRRGGWGRLELGRLERVAPQVALALRDRELATELAARVQELTSSRARLVRAEETVRRQVERDLHDGVQQQLVALLARLSLARELLEPASPATGALAAAHDLAGAALRDLRRLVTGIHPALLGDRGLAAAVEARSGLLPLDVVVDADPRIADHRFVPEVEGAAFFVVSEALANVMKHSGSEHARVVIAPLDGGGLRVAVADEGSGEASYDGSGLTGLRDRVEALGGRFLLQAAPGVGTTVVAEFPGQPAPVGSDA